MWQKKIEESAKGAAYGHENAVFAVAHKQGEKQISQKHSENKHKIRKMAQPADALPQTL